MDKIREDHDWCAAFSEAGLDINTVALVLACDEGENDGPSWIMVGQLDDGRYFSLEAGCDYTGWDCQASGEYDVNESAHYVWHMTIGAAERRRLEGQVKVGATLGCLVAIAGGAEVAGHMSQADRREFLVQFQVMHDKRESAGE